jgi:hypothetical protein
LRQALARESKAAQRRRECWRRVADCSSFVRSHHCHSSNLKSAANPGIPKSFPTTAFRYPGADAAALPREYLLTNWS